MPVGYEELAGNWNQSEMVKYVEWIIIIKVNINSYKIHFNLYNVQSMQLLHVDQHLLQM